MVLWSRRCSLCVRRLLAGQLGSDDITLSRRSLFQSAAAFVAGTVLVRLMPLAAVEVPKPPPVRDRHDTWRVTWSFNGTPEIEDAEVTVRDWQWLPASPALDDEEPPHFA